MHQRRAQGPWHSHMEGLQDKGSTWESLPEAEHGSA